MESKPLPPAAHVDKLNKLKDLYAKNTQERKAKIFLYGEWGTFKSTIAATMPRPILFHMFDPGGEKITHIQDGINDGSIIVDTSFQSRKVDGNTVSQYNKWNKEYNELKKAGVFENIGTFVVDSLTTLQKLVIGATIDSNAKAEYPMPGMPIKVAQMRDYNVQDAAMEFMLADIVNLPCHVLVIGHSEEGMNSKTEVMYHRPMIVGSKLKQKIPLLFDEVYVSKTLGSRGSEILTSPSGMFLAKSRLVSTFSAETKFKNTDVGDFHITRDILVPAGYATKEEIVPITKKFGSPNK